VVAGDTTPTYRKRSVFETTIGGGVEYSGLCYKMLSIKPVKPSAHAKLNNTITTIHE